MEHKLLDQLRSVADVQPPQVMTRQERLDRWITLLEQDPTRRLTSLEEIEYRPPAERARVREDNSPLSVAFDDPILRADGLASDRVGDAMSFFGLTEGQVHYAFCSCMSGRSMDASAFAQRLRNAVSNSDVHAAVGMWALAAAALAVPAILYLLG
ncbi:hypothetical protein [Microvirga antarctica]|uniref:hypothetical protein n=1 Tax=Microvirga antarctica TaxID=2819233 RepID=UPI001B30A8BA|nr:hypothetical protein [Microvirga antarctica]